MIITRTPLRISFAGGGTDLESFYTQEEGYIVAAAIDKYVWVNVSKRFFESIRVAYSRLEVVDNVDDIVHPVVRECLKKTGITSGIEIVTTAEVPAGTGLGSSSAFTVGLLNALHVYLGKPNTAVALAEEACDIEFNVLRAPVGKLDQYICAFGGLRVLRFEADGSVIVEPLKLEAGLLQTLEHNLMLFHTGITRSASDILGEQKSVGKDIGLLLREVKVLGIEAAKALAEGRLEDLGKILHHGWELKRKWTLHAANTAIDEYYEKARKAGAVGGKLLGVSNVLLMYCPEERQEAVRIALEGFREIPFRFDSEGSKVVFWQ